MRSKKPKQKTIKQWFSDWGIKFGESRIEGEIIYDTDCIESEVANEDRARWYLIRLACLLGAQRQKILLREHILRELGLSP